MIAIPTGTVLRRRKSDNLELARGLELWACLVRAGVLLWTYQKIASPLLLFADTGSIHVVTQIVLVATQMFISVIPGLDSARHAILV